MASSHVKSTTFMETMDDEASPEPSPAPPSFPPYPPYAVEPAPPSVADTIMAGRDIRYLYKSIPEKLKRPVRPVPRPAKPRSPKATDVKLSKRAARAHARCLRRHNAVLTDRLEHMSKPQKRHVIYLWREYWKVLPADTIARLRSMLDADQPFKPDQAYEYFVNLRKTKKKNAAWRENSIKKDVVSMVAVKRCLWARNATVAFARGIQQRLARPGRYALADGMLRLSDIILDEICGYMNMRKPSRRCTHPKAKFMMEMSDKIAIWIDDILSESDDRMLMMDFDEDYEVEQALAEDGRPGMASELVKAAKPMQSDDESATDAVPFASGEGSDSERSPTAKVSPTQSAAGSPPSTAPAASATPDDVFNADELGNDRFADDFLNMMGGEATHRKPPPAYLQFTEETAKAFDALMDTMNKKGDELLILHGKFKQTYKEGADELKRADRFNSTEYQAALAKTLNKELTSAVESVTPKPLVNAMQDMVDMSSKYLAQNAEFNRDKGPAFKLLVKELKNKGSQVLFSNDKGFRTFVRAATELEGAKSGLVSNHDPNLSQEICAKLFEVVEKVTPSELKAEMEDTVDIASKFLSENAVNESLQAKGGVVTEDGFYVDENGVKQQIAIGEVEDNFYVDERGIKRKKGPGEETFVDATGIRRINKSSPGPNKEQRHHLDEYGGKRNIGSKDETYTDEEGVKRSGQTPGGVQTEKAYNMDENENTKKVFRSEELEQGSYVDVHGIRKKNKPGEETYVDEQGITRKGNKHMADTITEEGYYVDEHGEKIKVGPGAAREDFYIDENGVRRKEKFEEKTYFDDQGIRKKGEKLMVASVIANGHNVDGQGLERKMYPRDTEEDFYIDDKGVRRKKRPEEETYLDPLGIRKNGKKPKDKATMKTEDGYYVDVHGKKLKMASADNESDYYTDEQGVRRKVKSGEETFVDEKGVRRNEKKSGTVDESVREAFKKMKLGRQSVSEDPNATSDGDTIDDESDPDRAAAQGIIHRELRSKGSSVLYQQPQTILTHEQASKWLKQKPRKKVDKTVRESADTARLQKNFERKLGELVSTKTPPHLQDAMQDVVIESSRNLSEHFVAKNYKALVSVGLISEMQKKGNEILVEVDDAAETFFYAAQRLKKVVNLEAKEPCGRIAIFLTKQLNDMIKSRSLARKVIVTMKEHVKEASDFLSEHVTKPDEQIEAYVALLREMESKGDALLVDGNIPKSYKSCATYLRQLTSFEDQISRSNRSLKSSIESSLKSLMPKIPPRGYSISTLNQVIRESAGLLVSYIMLQDEKTETLKVLVNKLKETGNNVLLRHGTIRKTCADGAEILREKNADQLMNVVAADPVVARKIQQKLMNLMRGSTPEHHQLIIDEVIEDTTTYLANYLLQPRMIQECKCKKNVLVQCELWCDEILRRVARPCCTCSRHVSAQYFSDLAPPQGDGPLQFAPGFSRSFSPAVDVSVNPCPSSLRPPSPCPVPHTTPCCPSTTATYMMYSTTYRRAAADRHATPKRERATASYAVYSASYRRRLSPRVTHSNLLSESQRSLSSTARSDPVTSYVAMYSTSSERRRMVASAPLYLSSPSYNLSPVRSEDAEAVVARDDGAISEQSRSSDGSVERKELFWRTPPSMIAPRLNFPRIPPNEPSICLTRPLSYLCTPAASSSRSASPSHPQSTSSSFTFTSSLSESFSTAAAITKKRNTPTSSGYATRPTVSTEQMSDWHAMMISLTWNVQAWCEWIQENITRALAYQPDTYLTPAESKESWASYKRSVMTEALQWQQYNTFIRQLTLRLVLRYQDKQVLSPKIFKNRTTSYKDCQEDTLEIIEMFNRWTKWLTDVLKESDLLNESGTEETLHELRWLHFKAKVEEYVEDWNKYNMHMKISFEQKYRTLMADWLPTWRQPGPVWVVSACGAVPSGAMAAGLYDQEVVWVARTTHKCNVVPAALHPSKHCCIVYADGAVHRYTKYQVMCNANAVWLPWRAGAVTSRAVRVAAAVHVGRVLYRGGHLLGAVLAPHYRCHVVIFGRPFAFNCYELLVLAENL